MSTSATTSTPGELKTGDLGSENGGKSKDLGDGAGEGGRSERTNELPQEATQLLRTLRVTPGNAKMRVMKLEGLDRVDEDYALIGSVATHGLRKANLSGSQINPKDHLSLFIRYIS